MKATLGRTVIVHGISSNGALEHPAVITRAWSDRSTLEGPVMVNLTVFPDCGPPINQGSVQLFHLEDAARSHRGGNPHAIVAWWPRA